MRILGNKVIKDLIGKPKSKHDPGISSAGHKNIGDTNPTGKAQSLTFIEIIN